MFILHLALGGCLKTPPVSYGITEDTGGHITYIIGAADAMSRLPGVDRVEIVTRLFREASLPGPYDRPRETIRPGLDIVRLATASPGYLCKDALAAEVPQFGEALVEYIASLDIKPDVIHAHFADAGSIAAMIRDRFGIPYVFTAHSLGIDKRDTMTEDCPHLERRIELEDAVIGQADAVVASSNDEITRQLVRYPSVRHDRLHRVAPGIVRPGEGGGPTTASELLAPFLREPDKPVILAIARPVFKKNLLGLIEMYGQSPEMQERANLVIVAGLRDTVESGECEQRQVIDSLIRAVDAYDLYGKVAYPKRHTQAEIAALYTFAKDRRGVFVNPAFTEPFGLTLLEAASFGLPVVATRHGGPVDIVGDIGHGALADPADMVTFERAVTTLLEDDAAWDRASTNALSGIRIYGWPAYARDCVDLYRDIASNTQLAAPAFRLGREAPVLFASDIDNTLTGDLPAAIRFDTAMRRCANMTFAVSTGRHMPAALDVLDKWSITPPDLLVTAVGTEIYWRQADGRLALDEDFHAAMSDNWRPDAVESALSKLDGLLRQPDACQGPFKRSWFVNSGRAVHDVQATLHHEGIAAHVIHSHGDLLDVVPEGAGKGSAVRWCARALDVPLDRTISAGDSGNDIDMLNATARAIVVGNGDADVRAGVGEACYSHARHAGGVLEGLHRFGLTGAMQ